MINSWNHSNGRIDMRVESEMKWEILFRENKPHIRNGSISEWETILKKDINYIEKILSEFNLNLNEFMLG